VLSRLSIAVLLTLAWALTGLAGADAAGTGNPVIVSPQADAALYEGFTGPFVVDFAQEEAPQAVYNYAVFRDPDGGGASTLVAGPYQYEWKGVGANPQFMVKALKADPHLRFKITDGAGHTAERSFEVRPGAAPRCALVVPTRVHVNEPVETVVGRLNSTCATLDTVSADWKVTHAGQVLDYFRFTDSTTDTWSVFDADPTGTYAILPLSARAGDNSAVPQNSPGVVVRRDSRLGFGGSRTGTKVTLRVTLSKYTASANAFTPWTGAHVVLAFRTCTTCSWQPLRTLTTNLHGQASGTFVVGSPHDFRVSSAGTSAIWVAPPKYLRK
jgi:hypothetical protein